LAKGRSLNEKRVPLAVEVVQSATSGLPIGEIAMALDVLKKVQANLSTKLDEIEATGDEYL
jgi:hypothetical protein